MTLNTDLLTLAMAATILLLLIAIVIVLCVRALKSQQKRFESELGTLTENHRATQASLDEIRATEKNLTVELAVKEEQLSVFPKLKQQNEEQAQQLLSLREKNTVLATDVAQLSTQLDNEKKQAEEKIALLKEAKDQLKLEFESVANKIFDEKGKKFTDQNQTNINVMLSPLKEQLKDFKSKVEDVYVKEAKDRTSLFNEIVNLKSLNQKISQDAINLTKALKGENKTQGNWGEMILERVLEESGLSKGREYVTQGSFTSEDGKRLQPDVVVHLPDGKDVVIDSKVSLTAYEKFCSCETEAEQTLAIKAHVQSIQSHVKGLSGKDYASLPGLRSLDFVLLFIPIEAAFLNAVDANPELFTQAFERNIMIVCPSTLLVTLKTIQNNWRYEYQNQNATKIADRAGSIYDQLVLFSESLEQVGKSLDQAQNAYGKAKDRLVSGRGNLVKKVEALKTLGAKTKKQISPKLLEEASVDTDDTEEIADVHSLAVDPETSSE